MAEKSSLTITDNRTGKSYELPSRTGRSGPSTCGRSRRRRRVRAHDVRSRVHEHRVVQARSRSSTATRASSAIAATRSSSSPRRRRSSRSRGCSATASCRRRPSTTSGCTTSRTTRTCTRTSRRSCRASATTRTRCRCSARTVARAVVVLSGREEHLRPGAARHLDRAAAREAADARRVHLPAREGAALRLSRTTISSYVENFLSMVARMSEPKYEANPVFAKALEMLFILHADHEQNCSTNAVRAVGSSHVDPFSAVAAGDRGALRPAARRRERAGAADDQGDRHIRRTSRRSSTR